MPSKGTPSSTRKRRPVRVAPRRSGGTRPSKVANERGAILDAAGQRPNRIKAARQAARRPSSGRRPCVVFNPTRSFHAAGMRTDPPVSDPTPNAASPKATDAAAPDDDPPGAAPWSFTQRWRGSDRVHAKPGIGKFGHMGFAKADRARLPRHPQHLRIAQRNAPRPAGPKPLPL